MFKDAIAFPQKMACGRWIIEVFEHVFRINLRYGMRPERKIAGGIEADVRAGPGTRP